MSRRLRTANYPLDRRHRLAQAVKSAREAMGYRSRPRFAAAAGIGVRSIEAVESLEESAPSVGETVLRAIGRTLPHWTEDTAKEILEGAPVPSNEVPDIVVTDANGVVALVQVKTPSRTAKLDLQWILEAPRGAVVDVSKLVEAVSGQEAAEKFLLDALELRRRYNDEIGDIEPRDDAGRDVS